MKTFEFILKHDAGTVTICTRADSLEVAKKIVLDAERAPERAIKSWRVVPTAKQVAKTKSLMRGI
jgi:hypothetical protein